VCEERLGSKDNVSARPSCLFSRPDPYVLIFGLIFVLANSRHDSRNSLMTEIYQFLKDTPIKEYQKLFQNLAKRLTHLSEGRSGLL